MRTSSIAALAAASALMFGGSAANATTFLLTFTGPLGSSSGGPIVIDATPDGGGVYTANSATGDIDGSAVTLLGPDGYAFNDNQITYPFTPALDFAGVSFGAGGVDYNLFLDGEVYSEACSCSLGFQSLDQFSLTEAPEPAAWALMLAGFTGLGTMLRRRAARVA